MMPRTDYHMHSEFSECSSDTSIVKNILEAQRVGLKRIAITDHGLELRPDWIGSYFQKIEEARRWCEIDVLTGIECDIGARGKSVVSPSLLEDFDVVIGSIHALPSHHPSGNRFTYSPVEANVLEEYRITVLSALASRWMRILAHPTDIGWSKILLPEYVEEEIASTLRTSNVAIEINFHHKDPALSLLQRCAAQGVTLTPVSDAHSLNEIGRFEWHKSVVDELGVEHVLWLSI